MTPFSSRLTRVLLFLPLLAAAPVLTVTPDGEVYAVPGGAVATFPAGTLTTAAVLRFDQGAMLAEVGEKVRTWALLAAPGLVVTVSGRDITFEAEGSTAAAVEQALAAAGVERERVYAAVLADRRLFRVGPGQVQYDHARIAAESAALVRPLAQALGAVPSTPAEARVYAERALAFVQGLPYERVTRATFAPPLALLREERGDCDEKATLYAALLRAAMPGLPVAVVTLDQHAIVVLGLPPRGADRAVTVDGATWIVAEPAGPALHPLGVLAPKTTLDAGFTLRALP
ncbi:MAG: hypothetical protein Q8P18_03930 [Pseudomonadota bacterium]|nr:hypothetical protein [Pseudomonadota bacterium]